MAWLREKTSAERVREYDRKYYAKLSPGKRAKVVRLKTERRQRIAAEIQEYKRTLKCACGESHPACLDFHHHEENKETTVANAISRGWKIERIMREIAKCIVVCANCHRKLHFNLKQGVSQQ